MQRFQCVRLGWGSWPGPIQETDRLRSGGLKSGEGPPGTEHQSAKGWERGKQRRLARPDGPNELPQPIIASPEHGVALRADAAEIRSYAVAAAGALRADVVPPVIAAWVGAGLASGAVGFRLAASNRLAGPALPPRVALVDRESVAIVAGLRVVHVRAIAGQYAEARGADVATLTRQSVLEAVVRSSSVVELAGWRGVA